MLLACRLLKLVIANVVGEQRSDIEDRLALGHVLVEQERMNDWHHAGRRECVESWARQLISDTNSPTLQALPFCWLKAGVDNVPAAGIHLASCLHKRERPNRQATSRRIQMNTRTRPVAATMGTFRASDAPTSSGNRSTSSVVLKAIVAAILAMGAVSGNAQSQPEPFVSVGARINPVMSPRNLEDALRDCQNSPLCQGLAASAIGMLGVPPLWIAMGSAAVANVERQAGSEESKFEIWLPEGYVFCRAEVSTISVTPASGDRASLLSVSSTQDGLSVYTWTPRQGCGGGRSWIDANATVVGVLPEHQSKAIQLGYCTPPGRNFMNCRGRDGGKGRPGCGTSRG